MFVVIVVIVVIVVMLLITYDIVVVGGGVGVTHIGNSTLKDVDGGAVPNIIRVAAGCGGSSCC